MTHDGRRTTPWVWHKLPTGELKRCSNRKYAKKMDPQDWSSNSNVACPHDGNAWIQDPNA